MERNNKQEKESDDKKILEEIINTKQTEIIIDIINSFNNNKWIYIYLERRKNEYRKNKQHSAKR